MKKTAKRLLSMLLVFALVLGVAPLTAWAAPSDEKTATAEATVEAAAEAAETTQTINLSAIKGVNLLKTDGVEVDEEDPAIIAVKAELQNMKVLNADGESVALTDEQIKYVLSMYQEYLNQWAENADILGVQTPLFLSYNDNEDGLGVLGEMLMLSKIKDENGVSRDLTVDDIRNGNYSYDDLTGMIMNFYYGDQLGIKYYGSYVESARDEILALVEESGAVTDAQKYLVINNWLAQNVIFDMEYIMNADKADDKKPMVAENAVEHEHYQDVYEVMYDVYESQIRDTFEQKIRTELEKQFKVNYYTEAIKSVITDLYTAGAVSDAAKDENVVAAVKEAYRQKVYEEKLDELADSDVYESAYDARFNKYLDDNCEHEFETVFTFVDNGDGTYSATADLTCTICDRFHDDVEAVTENKEVDATCTEPKKTVCVATVTVGDYTASEEKVLSTVGEALGHTEVTDAAVAATCTENGLTEGKHCSVCNEVLVAQGVVPANGHSYGDDGVCTVCGAIEPTEENGSEEGGSEVEDSTVENHPQTLAVTEAGAEIRKDADAVAKLAADDAVKAAAEDAADKAVNALTDEDVQAMAEEQVKSDEATMAQIDASVAEKVDAYMTEHAEAIQTDPVAFVDGEAIFQTEVPVTDENGNYIIGEDGNPITMTIAAQLHAGWEDFWKQAQETGVEVDPVNAPGVIMTVDQIVEKQMDTPQEDPMLQKYDENGEPIEGEYMSPNEAIPVFAKQAAVGLADGILNYWQGTQFGALGRGSAVCLGYTKAFAYLVQCLHPEIYGVNGAKTDLSVAKNWKAAADLYYDEDGNLDVTKNYAVDCVRITFDAQVTMFGETEDNFNSDHFWNAVQIDGQWYYVDPCYVDVYTEVMIRDRVETDGYMNHLYFLFSHGSAVDLYDGNYSEIKTLYGDGSASPADSTAYEDSWISRIKSNIYFEDGNAYYIYDSTDMITIMEEYENNSTDIDLNDFESKLVYHKLTNTDANDQGDTDYTTLIEFNYYENEDDEESEARFLNADGKMETSELLTTLYADHQAASEIYPSLAITCALYDGKLYFNLDTSILSYDLETCTISRVKEYNTVYGVRDDTNPFGGMAFSTTDSASNADFTVYNHPIAGISLKEDGNLYVSIATNFAFISGKSAVDDQSSYGYEYEESNFNPDYNSYTASQYEDNSMYEQMGYEKETNDNDEFMWSANFVETISMSELAGTKHDYEEVHVDATCRHNAYTENRCADCGAIEADTRVEEEGTAHAHHYIYFYETYYTKNDNGNKNTGSCYVCTECGFSIEEPTEPQENSNYGDYGTSYEEQMEEYEKEKAIYDEAVATAGHTYEPTDAVWADDHSTATFSALECSAVCPERANTLDCLLVNDDYNAPISVTLSEKVTAESSITDSVGLCPDGVTATYTISGEVEQDGTTYAYSLNEVVELDPADHKFEGGICSICGDCAVKRVKGKTRVETAIKAADTLKATLGVESFDTIIVANGNNFADALTGSYLANAKSAPILLYTESGTEQNEEYILNNLSADGVVYILGGGAAVPAEFEDSLNEADITVERLSGKTRYDTNLEILKEAVIADKEILITTGLNFADSLSASATGLPILMVNTGSNKLTENQIAFLEEHADNSFTIVGGTGAVSDELEAAIEEIVGKDVARVSGKTREDTSVKIAETYFGEVDFVLLAYSRNFPDGLCGGPLAYALGAPLLLTADGNEQVAVDYVDKNEVACGYVMGGTAAVSEESAKLIFGITSDGEIPAV